LNFQSRKIANKFLFNECSISHNPHPTIFTYPSPFSAFSFEDSNAETRAESRISVLRTDLCQGKNSAWGCLLRICCELQAKVTFCTNDSKFKLCSVTGNKRQITQKSYLIPVTKIKRKAICRKLLSKSRPLP
jgi:hypothetical protein